MGQRQKHGLSDPLCGPGTSKDHSQLAGTSPVTAGVDGPGALSREGAAKLGELSAGFSQISVCSSQQNTSLLSLLSSVE